MTDTAPPPPATDPPPPPKRRVSTQTRAFIAIAMVGAASAAAIAVTTGALPIPFASPNPTKTASAAGICGPGTVSVHPMTHNGVALYVTAPGPDVVTVDVTDGWQHRRLTQQVTKRAEGAEFALWDFTFNFKEIDVGRKTSGVCAVSAGVLDELNRTNRWSR